MRDHGTGPSGTRQLERFDALTQQIDGMLDALRTQKKEVL